MMHPYLRRIASSCSVVRFEVKALVCTMVGMVKTRLLFRRDRVNKLEIGVGNSKRKDGFITTDIVLKTDYPYDLRGGLPFPSTSLDVIYAEHVLEHFEHGDLRLLLRECYRTLKPRGTFSIVVPNAEIYLRAYSEPEHFDYKKYCTYDFGLTFRHKIDYVNYIFYMDGQHRYMFDRENLLSILRETGFTDVRLRDFDPALDQPERKNESIYAVCSK